MVFLNIYLSADNLYININNTFKICRITALTSVPATKIDISPPILLAAVTALPVTAANFPLSCSAITNVLWFLIRNH